MAICHMFRMSFTVLWTNPNKIPNMLITSGTVILLFSRTCLFIPLTDLFCFLMDDKSIWHLEQRLHPFWSWKPLKDLYFSHSLLSKSHFQHFNTFHSIFPSIQENSMLTCCYFKSAIFQVCKNHTWAQHTCTKQDITQPPHMLQSYPEMNDSADCTLSTLSSSKWL